MFRNSSAGTKHFLREILTIARHVKHDDRSGRKLSDVLAQNREKLKDRPSRIKFSFNLVRHGSPTYSLLLLSQCLISAHFIGPGQSFLSESTLCEREREREKKKINKGKILEIERIKKFLFYESSIPERFLKSKYLRIFILPPFLRLKYIEKIFILVIIPIRMAWMQSRGFLILRLMYFQIVFHSQVIGSFTIIIRT